MKWAVPAEGFRFWKTCLLRVMLTWANHKLRINTPAAYRSSGERQEAELSFSLPAWLIHQKNISGAATPIKVSGSFIAGALALSPCGTNYGTAQHKQEYCNSLEVNIFLHRQAIKLVVIRQGVKYTPSGPAAGTSQDQALLKGTLLLFLPARNKR